MARSLWLVPAVAVGLLAAAACSESVKQCPSFEPPDLSQEDTRQEGDLGEDLPRFDLFTDVDLVFDYLPGDGVGLCSKAPFTFGCPCEGNTDCSSGFCVEGPYGFVCSQECLEECPEGWICRGIQGFGVDLVFVCVPSSKKLCYPCQTDLQCGSQGVCAQFSDGSYCSYRCSDANPCPTGFVCGQPEEGGDAVCKPESGSCECTGDTSGQIRPCTKANEFGTCFGYETCEAGVGFVNCTASDAAPEVCDGIDNDCDGSFDEELPLSQPCEKEIPGVGTCTGEEICFGAQGWVCTAAEPTDEVCDYKDNDCDGFIDETFTDESGLKYVDFSNCGSCGTSCAFGFPNATAKCDANREVPQCVVESCDQGFFLLNEFQCVPLIATLCEPCAVDESCVIEGAKCVPLNDGLFCTKPCSAQSNCPPGYNCQDVDGSTQCIPASGSCSCDGTNLLLSKSCTASWPLEPLPGEPLTICYGTQKCTSAGWTDCILPEDTCDGADNDCNGVIDDGLLVDGKYVTALHCGKCGNNCTFVSYPNAEAVCDSSLAMPACSMACLPNYVDVNLNTADGCECHVTSQTDLPDGIDQNCDNVDGEEDNAIFVAKNGTDTATGSREDPMLSIQAAINKALVTDRRDVYVATGVYTESILLAAGVQVYGGYSSDFTIRDTILYESAIIGTPSTAEKPGAVNAIGITTGEPTVFAGFSVFGRNASAASGSSYSIYVRDCGSVLTITGNKVVAGHGAAGSPGTGGVDGSVGLSGSGGKAAYSLGDWECVPGSNLTSGGTPGSLSCDGTNVSGGIGGSNSCPTSEPPASIEPGANGQGPGAGSGGAAGWDSTLNFDCSLCTMPSDQDPPKPVEGEDGLPGADGALGTAGAGCTVAAGLVTAGLWQPVAGGPGGFGVPGSGGGGGGAGGGADRISFSPTCNDMIGGSGGGGGSGGCPGTSGTGGSGGGASFAIFVVFSAPPAALPAIVGNTLTAGMGGSGGSGGYGGTGGPGGSGGSGGTGGKVGSSGWCAKSGGGGGDGGDGGHGGGGGGGCGGVSYCIYAFSFGSANLSALKNASNPCTQGTGGLGGSGGPSLGHPGGNGASGSAGTSNL